MTGMVTCKLIIVCAPQQTYLLRDVTTLDIGTLPDGPRDAYQRVIRSVPLEELKHVLAVTCTSPPSSLIGAPNLEGQFFCPVVGFYDRELVDTAYRIFHDIMCREAVADLYRAYENPREALDADVEGLRVNLAGLLNNDLERWERRPKESVERAQERVRSIMLDDEEEGPPPMQPLAVAPQAVTSLDRLRRAAEIPTVTQPDLDINPAMEEAIGRDMVARATTAAAAAMDIPAVDSELDDEVAAAAEGLSIGFMRRVDAHARGGRRASLLRMVTEDSSLSALALIALGHARTYTGAAMSPDTVYPTRSSVLAAASLVTQEYIGLAPERAASRNITRHVVADRAMQLMHLVQDPSEVPQVETAPSPEEDYQPTAPPTLDIDDYVRRQDRHGLISLVQRGTPAAEVTDIAVGLMRIRAAAHGRIPTQDDLYNGVNMVMDAYARVCEPSNRYLINLMRDEVRHRALQAYERLWPNRPLQGSSQRQDRGRPDGIPGPAANI